MGYAYILDLLRQNNPFVSDSVADPWEDIYPSVVAIHARPFQELSSLVTQKANSPTLAIGALVLGEAGSGKTHLVKRIVETVHKANRPLLMAYVQPIESPQYPYSYLLREIVGNLRRPLNRGTNWATQLDRLLSRWLLEYLGPEISALSPAMSAAVQSQPEKILNLNLSSIGMNMPVAADIPRSLRKILPYYQRKEQRQAIADWLAGDALDSEHLEVLKLPNRLAMSAEAREAEALELLVAIGELLTRYHYCLLVCFDRWENLESQAQLSATGRMVGELFDRIRGMLPIVLARRMDWDERLSVNLNQHVVSRIENNKFMLGNCDRENALALIKSRLAFVLEGDADGIEPFTQEQLDRLFEVGGLSPRAVIALANEQLRSILNDDVMQVGPSVADVLLDEFTNRYQQALMELGQSAPDKGRLLRTLQVLLSGIAGVAIKEPKSVAKDKFDLLLQIAAGTVDQNREVALIIDLEQHHSAVNAAMERGLHHLTKMAHRRVVYVRDGRHPIPNPPKWPATNERRERLEQRGALLWTLNAEQAAGWYAVADLAYAVKAGDVTLAYSGRLQILTSEDLNIWAAEGLRDHAAFAPLWKFLEQFVVTS